ncbi:MAG: histidine phosphatase family protein [Syntrophobacterales bacterium]|nr:MAG: histidine phosphatase family protein [Syntrophobacterales bacterium]
MDTPTRLYLMRHGQVENFVGETFNGHKDVDITAHGVRQMEAVAERLRDEDLAAVYCSDLIRTRKGADIIAVPHGLVPQSLSTLRELDVKLWEGLNAEGVEERFPGAFDAWRAQGADYRIPGGESIRDLTERVIPALREILGAHDGKNIVLVAHGGVNRVILADAMGAGFDRLYSIEQNYGCMNIIDYLPGYAVVRLVNRQLLDEK